MQRIWLVSFAALLVACGGGNIEGVKTFDFKGGQHQQGRIDYENVPPAGGTHNPVWQDCGVYDAPIAAEHVVHSLEHGAVWIAYRPDLSEGDVAKLRELVDGRSYTLLAPHPDLSAPIVATAWNHQLSVESAGDERLERFVDKYENGSQAPERGATCSGGTAETL